MTYALTLADARRRAAAVTVEDYRLHLDLTRASDSDVFGVATEITLTSADAEIALDYLGDRVDSVRVDGAPAEHSFDDGQLFVTVPTGRTVVLAVESVSRYSRTGQGLHRFTDPADGRTYLYSHFEPSDARRVYPSFDQPDLKARFHVSMTVPEGWTALSNGAETGRDGATVSFAPTPPLSTYLTAFAAGEYVRASHGFWNDVELGVWARASMAEYVDDEFLQTTHDGLTFFHEVFDFPYPWGKYDSIMVPEYNLGAMENPGLVTFTENFLFRDRATRGQHAQRANTTLHEMCHMWFGDLVTPLWWDDLWLKESFAEFMGADASLHATDYAEARANFAGNRKNWAYQQDQLPTTHPIAAQIDDVDAARQNFDGITYAKGAAVLTQLVHFIGRDAFFAGSRDYFRAHAFGTATFDDLLAALSNHTDEDLTAWSEAWLKTSGPDRLDPSLVGDTLTITHTGNRPHRFDVGVYSGGRRTDSIDVTLAADDDQVSVDLPAGAEAVILNDTDHTYALTGLDKRTLLWVREGLSTIEEPLTRAVVWTSLWNLCRDGRLPVADFVDVVVRHAPAEENPGMLARALDDALLAAREFTSEHGLPTELADRLWGVLLQARPGSDQQLAVARATISALAGSASSTSGERLRTLLDARVPGVDVDAELAWSVRAALAARGEIDESELAAARAEDDTMSGNTRFLRAAHSTPSKGAKAEVYRLVTEPGAWANDEVDALLAAFNAPGSAVLRQDLAERYFSDVEKLWEQHPMEIANRLVRGLFPDTDDTGERTDAVLAGDVPAALRRVLAECRDEWERRTRLREINPVSAMM